MTKKVSIRKGLPPLLSLRFDTLDHPLRIYMDVPYDCMAVSGIFLERGSVVFLWLCVLDHKYSLVTGYNINKHVKN